MEGLDGKGHVLYMEVYYSSPELFVYMYEGRSTILVLFEPAGKAYQTEELAQNYHH
jgi:hypothetical protein